MKLPLRLMTASYRPSASAIKPKSSEVLTCYLQQLKEPPWTSYFVKYSSIENDQRGMSHFNWAVGCSNYHILRTGCYPYIKYHCSKRPVADLSAEDQFFRIIKIMNLGIPCLAYGIAAVFLIRHQEDVLTPKGKVTIYFLYEEDKGSLY
ncbi:uncharacterized protein C15orf61 homolog [Ischnura elegans]|uniref:uncharacterized protein C15orf61 homolog n=1 Tax=Ischnura elegans TaxID=197161 RepID=UPI001ED872DD|nr:uncharacterized protein C15orf61 homolog [Ischnura elegans]